MNEVDFLTEYKAIIVGFHLFGTVLGLGGATISDLMFFKFLKDLKISKWESSVLATLSKVIWVGITIIVLSGLGLYLENMEALGQSSKFQIKMVVVAVIIVNGFFLNWIVAPNLVKISFGQKHQHKKGELRSIRKIAFSLGGVSIVSWYSAFVLGLMRGIDLNFYPLLLIYLGLLLVFILFGQVMERVVMSRER